MLTIGELTTLVSATRRDGLRTVILKALTDELNDAEALYCTRDESAWGYGTMGADDFVNYADDGDLMNQLADAVMAAIGQES
jgi:hypothetical protein